MNLAIKSMAALAMAVSGTVVFAQTGETVKIAHIEGFSGAFGNVGQNQFKSWQYVAERMGAGKSVTNPAGVRFEFAQFDNKSSPQESTTALKAAIDQGYRYVTQGNGSGAALAISEAVTKYNERNPGKEVIYLNYAAVDPALTNDKCSYWHFRLDADTTMKMEALTTFMKDQPKVKKIFLLNQNYSHGQQVSKYFKEGIARKRPDVQIVGDDMVPLGQVKDFSPYVAKIKQAGADTVVTGNWGQDMTLFIKAMNDAGLKLPIYAYYANVSGTPTALAAGGDNMDVSQVAVGYSFNAGELSTLRDGFKKKFNDDFYTFQISNGLALLSAAIAKAKSTDPVKVAAAMEGLSVKMPQGEMTMRKSDHQLQQPLYISKWTKVSPKSPYSEENSGYNFALVKVLEPYVSSTPTTCQMKRPS